MQLKPLTGLQITVCIPMWLHELLSTGFYTGTLKYAPGTWGSLLSALFASVYGSLFPHGFQLVSLSLAGFFLILGVISSGMYARFRDDKDPGYIVIDEISGQFLTYAFLPFSFVNIFMGFLLFRFFDIVKLWPCKPLQDLPEGYGIMFDDIAAGLQAAICVYVLNYFFPAFMAFP